MRATLGSSLSGSSSFCGDATSEPLVGCVSPSLSTLAGVGVAQGDPSLVVSTPASRPLRGGWSLLWWPPLGGGGVSQLTEAGLSRIGSKGSRAEFGRVPLAPQLYSTLSYLVRYNSRHQ